MLRLKLAITAINKFLRVSSTSDGFDVLLTQSDDALITQNEIFIVRQTLYGSLLSQNGLVFITQDGQALRVDY